MPILATIRSKFDESLNCWSHPQPGRYSLRRCRRSAHVSHSSKMFTYIPDVKVKMWSRPPVRLKYGRPVTTRLYRSLISFISRMFLGGNATGRSRMCHGLDAEAEL